MKELITIIICIITIIYLYNYTSSENFDTYRNHNDFANKYYNMYDPKILDNTDEHTTDLYAKYMWNEKNKNGLELYDHYYEELNNRNYNGNKDLNVYTKGKRYDPFTYINGQKISLNQGIY